MSYTFIECPRCSTTMRPGDRNIDGGGYVCWECGLEFELDDYPGPGPNPWAKMFKAIGLCGRDEY